MCNDVEPEKTHVSYDKYKKIGLQNFIPAALGCKSTLLFISLKLWGKQMVSYDLFVKLNLISLELFVG